MLDIEIVKRLIYAAGVSDYYVQHAQTCLRYCRSEDDIDRSLDEMRLNRPEWFLRSRRMS